MPKLASLSVPKIIGIGGKVKQIKVQAIKKKDGYYLTDPVELAKILDGIRKTKLKGFDKPIKNIQIGQALIGLKGFSQVIKAARNFNAGNTKLRLKRSLKINDYKDPGIEIVFGGGHHRVWIVNKAWISNGYSDYIPPWELLNAVRIKFEA